MTRPEAREGAELLEELAAFVRRFVVLTDAQATAIALWIVHTHAFAAADTTPYLSITSAEMRSGKTRLLEVLELLVREPLPTANISDAALFRVIAKLTPTLLLDEVDAIYGPKARDREDLRGLLNAGYRDGALVRRMGGARMTTLEEFPVYCAKAFAGIGKLPSTVADRAIGIRLERRTRDERIERFRRRDAASDAEPLHQWASSWGEHHVPALTEARPELPDELDDRAQEFWEPLLAIADRVGGDWPESTRVVAIQLSGAEARNEEESQTAALLRDIHHVFEANGTGHYRTADLIEELCKIEESPWGDWYGKPLTGHGLSRLLRPHRIKTMAVWVEGEARRGYKREQFTDAFSRVLSVRSVRSVRSDSAAENTPNAPNSPNASGTGKAENGPVPIPGGDGFLEFIAAAHRAGHITTAEALERERTHALIQKAGAA